MTTQYKILIIEDDALFSKYMCMALGRAGYDTMAVRDGLTALDVLALYHPDVIFLDMRLPILNGWGFLQKYREQPGANSPIIASSASNVDSTSLGINVEFVPKPFRIDSFLTVVGNLCAPFSGSSDYLIKGAD